MVNDCKRPHSFIFHVLQFLFLFYAQTNGQEMRSPVGIGVVLDRSSACGTMVNLCMDMAIADFYSAHPNYETRLQLHKKDAKSVLDVNVAVQELVKNEEVHGILVPQGSIQDIFVDAIRETNFHVPIIPLIPTSSSMSQTENRYFIGKASDEAAQAQALAAVCQRFEWPEVVILYEGTDDGIHFLSHLIEAFQDVDIGVSYVISIPTSANDTRILKELNKLNKRRTRVFLAHVGPTLGSRLLSLANAAGMMKEGYAWIVTDRLSIFLDSMNSDARASMDGVLEIRPYLFASENLKSFGERWKRNMVLNNTTVGTLMQLNIHGLWAYDAVTALAIAVENIGHSNDTNISSFGPSLLNELSNTKFTGLAGDFELVDGKLKTSTFEIFNIIGNGERKIGFWTRERGVIRELNSYVEETNSSTPMKELKNVVWPGDSVIRPIGLESLAAEHFRVGIPWKPGFKEFVNVVIDPETNRTHASGFCLDIFLAALKVMPFTVKYEYHIYNDSLYTNWSYDAMLHKIPKEYDMVVADATIWAPRSSYVDFTHPYADSGVVLVVKNKKPSNMWIFFKPLRWDLWVAILVSCILLGITLRILENRVNRNNQELVMQPAEQPRRRIYCFPLSFLALPETNMVRNKWSIFVLVCWLFMAYILMQSFTANLSAILTVDQLDFAFSDDYYVGYHNGSFLKEFLTEHLHIKESRMKAYSSAEEYHDALSRGSQNGGIDAIFDELPYMKLLLNRYKSQYKIVGPTYRTGGLGFAFPIGSPLVAHFSRAILNVTQGPDMNFFEQKNFGPGYSLQDPLSSDMSQGTPSLTFYEFGGLFIITGSLVGFAIICSICSENETIMSGLTNMMRYVFPFCFKPQERPAEVAHVNGDAQPPPPPHEEGTNAPAAEQPTQKDDVIIDVDNEIIGAQDTGVEIVNHV